MATLTASIERTLELRTAQHRVWAALVEHEQLDRWWGGMSGADLGPDVEGWFEWPGYGRFAYRVEAFEPPRRLACRWARERDAELDACPTTLVEFTLEPRDDGGTTLRLQESGFTEEDWRRENSQGWDEELGKLVAALEGGPIS